MVKRLTCPRIVVTPAARPKYASRQDAWTTVGPVIARILAQTIRRERERRARKARRRKRSRG
jgi:hypothetical protein